VVKWKKGRNPSRTVRHFKGVKKLDKGGIKTWKDDGRMTILGWGGVRGGGLGYSTFTLKVWTKWREGRGGLQSETAKMNSPKWEGSLQPKGGKDLSGTSTSPSDTRLPWEGGTG